MILTQRKIMYRKKLTMKKFHKAVLLAAPIITLSTPAAMAHELPVDTSHGSGVTHSGAELTLSVTDIHRDFTYSTTLQCMPNGGDHSNVWSACHSLKQADGDFDRVAPLGGEMCAKDYKPVIFKASGHWKGEELRWSQQFPNQCTGNIETGGIFDF